MKERIVSSMPLNIGTKDNPLELTKENIIDFIMDTEFFFDEKGLSNEKRFLALPSWVILPYFVKI